MEAREVLDQLQALANPEAVAGLARFGIKPGTVYGISVPDLRKLARQIGPDHDLAQHLWATGVHEARILAGMIDQPALVSEEQMDQWAEDFDSWDVCDQCCLNLFAQTEFAFPKAIEWSARPEEFVKRAGFALMAVLAVHDKTAPDEQLARFLPIIKREAADPRNFVKKAVNWALRQIGKRNTALNRLAIETAQEIQAVDSPAARWIASDALRELTCEKVQQRLGQVD